MKVFVALLCGLTVVFCQSCDNSFKAFLDCLAADSGDSVKGKVLEDEFDSSFTKQVRACFDGSVSSSNTQCVLSDANLNSDCWGSDGPLRGCDKCIELAGTIKKAVLSSNNEMRKCVRDEFSKAVVNDIQPCIRTELGDQTFNVPALPDFDLHSDAFTATIETGLCHRIQAYSRLTECKTRSPARAAVSSRCMDNKKGLYPKHCELFNKCKSSQVQSQCNDKFSKTQLAVCKCFNTKRVEQQQTLDKIKDAVFNSQRSPTICETGVINALGHWVNDFETIFKKCIPPGTGGLPNIPLVQLIHAGCVKAVDLDDDGKNQLVIGFRFIRNILDAVSDRVDRFCDIC